MPPMESSTQVPTPTRASVPFVSDRHTPRLVPIAELDPPPPVIQPNPHPQPRVPALSQPVVQPPTPSTAPPSQDNHSLSESSIGQELMSSSEAGLRSPSAQSSAASSEGMHQSSPPRRLGRGRQF